MSEGRRQVLRTAALGLGLWGGFLNAQQRRIVLDFTDPETARALWVVNDGVMGGISRSAFRAEPEGVVFEGQVSLENNGGFASLRSPAAFPAGASTLELTARGDGKRYKFILRTEASPRAPIYQCDFVAGAEWQVHRFLPEDFQASFRGRAVDAPRLVFSEAKEFGILIADKQVGEFRLQLARLDTR